MLSTPFLLPDSSFRPGTPRLPSPIPFSLALGRRGSQEKRPTDLRGPPTRTRPPRRCAARRRLDPQAVRRLGPILPGGTEVNAGPKLQGRRAPRPARGARRGWTGSEFAEAPPHAGRGSQRALRGGSAGRGLGGR
jgi:hypothetical protein